MAWTHLGGGTGNDGGVGNTHTTVTASPGVAVSAGNLICVGTTFGSNHGWTSGSVTDSLGNAYHNIASATDGVNSQTVEVWYSIVTISGTPVITLQGNPTPGTSQTGSIVLVVDIFSGSDGTSTSDGSGAAQAQASPGTGTDATSSGTWATTSDGDLIYTVIVDSATGANSQNTGTGFTAGTTAALQSAFKTQVTHSASTAGTWTATVNDAHVTAALAISPPTGVATVSDEGQIWIDVWKAAKPYVPIVTVYN